MARALIVPVLVAAASLAVTGEAAAIAACAEHVYIFQTNSTGRTVGPGTDTRSPGGFNMNTRDFTNNWVTMGGEVRHDRSATFYFRTETGDAVFTKTTRPADGGGVIRQEPEVLHWGVAQPGQKLFVYSDFHTRCGGDDIVWYNVFVGTIMTYPSAPVEVNPKFVVLSVQYAPPGRQSSVDYGQSTTVGSRISFNNSFTGGITVTNTNPINERLSITTSAGFSQRATFGGSDSVEKLESSNVVVQGPTTATEDIPHEFDLFEVWLNARFTMTSTSPTAVETSGFSVDTRDPVPGMDIVRLSVAELKNPTLIPAGTASRLSRSWSPTGALSTTEDFNAILAHNPFANGGTTIDPVRFKLIDGVNFDYRPAPPGGQPVTERFGVRVTESSADSQSFTTTVKVDKTVTTTGTQNPIADFEDKLKSEHKMSRSLEVSFSLNLDQTNTASQSTNVSITGPSTGYQGPTALRLYQDNVFGTLMFAFAPVATFQVAAPSPNQTVTQGGSAAFPVTTQSSFEFQDPVNFEPNVMGLPAGAQATFAPTAVGVGGGSTMTVTTTVQTPPGSYPLTFTASSGLIHRHVTVNLTVNPLPFTMTAAPASRTVISGQSTSYTVTVNAAPGFGGPVTLSGPGGLPPGTTATLTPRVLDNGSGTSTLTVTTSASTPSRSSTLTITGTGGGVTQRAAVTLVTDAAQDFGLTVAPDAAGVEIGGTADYTVTTTAINGFGGTVSLAVSGLPPGTTPSFTVNPITGAGSSTLRVATTTSTPPGDYSLTIIGTGGGRGHSQTVTLSVSDFTLTSAPTARLAAPGDSAMFTISTAAIAGQTGGIGLSVAGLPTGTTGTFNHTPVSPGAGSTLEVHVNPGTAPGDYPLSITGTSGGRSHSETVTLSVISPEPGLTLALDRDALTVGRGGGGVVSIWADAEFVELSLTGLPPGVTASFDANPMYHGTSLWIGVGSSAPPGTYALTITGTIGSYGDSRTLTLTVT